MKSLIINEFFIVSSNFWTYIDSRFRELFTMISKKVFADLTVVDVLQLPPAKGKVIFSQLFDHSCGQ